MNEVKLLTIQDFIDLAFDDESIEEFYLCKGRKLLKFPYQAVFDRYNDTQHVGNGMTALEAVKKAYEDTLTFTGERKVKPERPSTCECGHNIYDHEFAVVAQDCCECNCKLFQDAERKQ